MKGKREAFWDLSPVVSSSEAKRIFKAGLRSIARDVVLEAIAEEVTLLCGPKHAPASVAACRRAGSCDGKAWFEGEWLAIKRPRVRRRVGPGEEEEVRLESYGWLKDPAEFRERVLVALGAGVSARGQRCISGAGRSATSRIWAEAGAKVLERFRGRDVAGEEWACLMLDGVWLCDGLVAVVALGVTMGGRKEFLDFEFGAEENLETASALVARLVRRGFGPAVGCRLLTVLDGSEALRKAVLRHFPDAVTQRCLVHKERNVQAHLSRKHWKELSRRFRRLRLAEGEAAAKEALGELERFLQPLNRAALASLMEGGEDLTAFHRLNVPATLNASFLSTNFIENGFNNVRRKIGRVKRWRKETEQPERWMALALTEAEKGFRRVRNAGDMPRLREALKVDKGAAEDGESPPLRSVSSPSSATWLDRSKRHR